MATIKESLIDDKFFNLNGLLYQRGLWEVYYDNKISESNGGVNAQGVRVGIKRIGGRQEPIQSPIAVTSWFDGLGVQYTNYSVLVKDITTLIENKIGDETQVNISRNELGYDAWGRAKTMHDLSIFHGMFTYNVPIPTWKEIFNGITRPFVNATSENGKLSLEAGNTLNDKTILRTYRNPRYEPNRGHLYSTSVFLPNPNDLGKRRWGFFTEESGAFFSLESGNLYAVVRTTVNSVTSDDKYLLDTTGIDLSKGNTYDIQMQWRGVGNYKFFINLVEVKLIEYIGTLNELTTYNPANPLCFECENNGNNVVLECGCVDVTSEGGIFNGKTYGSISVDNDSGQVAISGLNQPIIAVRSKPTVGGLINTRDTLALLASAYSDQRSVFRVWTTRDWTAITENDQVWRDFGDGHLEYMIYDTPDVVTPMSFDSSKADLVFGCRLDQDQTYATSALFEGRTSIYLTPEEMFIFTIHRETGGAANVGVTFEFAEEI